MLRSSYPKAVHRGISAVIGGVILLLLFSAFAAFAILSIQYIEQSTEISLKAISRRLEAYQESQCIAGIWSFNSTHIIVNLSNSCPKTATVSNILMVFSNGSYIYVDRYNGTVEGGLVIYYPNGESKSLQVSFPLALCPGCRAELALPISRKPLSISFTSSAYGVTVTRVVREYTQIITGSDCDWIWNGSILYANLTFKYVGIGTANPEATLHVNGSVIFEGLPVGTGSYILTIDTKGRVYATPLTFAPGDYDWLWNGSKMYANPQATAIGIGTTSPEAPLHVVAYSITGYRIRIENPNSVVLTNYSIRVDITGLPYTYFRIVDPESGGELPFCYEQPNRECNETRSNAIWVRVPEIPPSSVKYLEVVRADSNHAVNGSQVFEFYEDFNRNKVFEEMKTGDGYYELDTKKGFIHIVQTRGGGYVDYGVKIGDFDLSRYPKGSLIVEARVKISNPGELHLIAFKNTSNPSNDQFYKIYGSQSWKYVADRMYSGSGNWETVYAKLNDFTDGDMVGLAVDYDAGSKADLYCDWIRIRKYIEPEPRAFLEPIKQPNPSALALLVVGRANITNITISGIRERDDLNRFLVIDENGNVFFRTIASLHDWDWVKIGNIIYANATRVGIGTTTPSATLHVVGDTIINGTLRLLRLAQNNNLSYALLYDPSTGIIYYGIPRDEDWYYNQTLLWPSRNLWLNTTIYLPRLIENDTATRFLVVSESGKLFYRTVKNLTDEDWLWNNSRLYANPRAIAIGIGTVSPRYPLEIVLANTSYLSINYTYYESHRFDSFTKHTLYNAHHNPTTRDIYDYYWSDAGRDAFDGYGYTYIYANPDRTGERKQIVIRPPENGGPFCSKYRFSDGREYIVCRDMLPNQYNRPTVLRIVIIPANDLAKRSTFSVYRYGNLGSDSRTYSNYYSFTYNGRTYRYIMTWDWSSTPGYGDPNIWYFMFSVGKANYNDYSYSRSGDNLYETLRNAANLTVLYLAPSDNPLGDLNIVDLLRQEIAYWEEFWRNYSNCTFDIDSEGLLIATCPKTINISTKVYISLSLNGTIRIEHLVENPLLDRVLVWDPETGLIYWKHVSALGGGDTDWLWNGTYLYTRAERVGIGTSSPLATLDIAGNLRIENISQNNALNRVLVVDENGFVYWRNASTFIDHDWSYSDTWIWPAKNVFINTTFMISVPRNDSLDRVLVLSPNGTVYWRNASTLIDKDWIWSSTKLYANPNATAIGIGTESPEYPLEIAIAKDVNVTLPGGPGTQRIPVNPPNNVLYNAHHNPTTRDIYDYYWSDAGRDAFDGYGYTYIYESPDTSGIHHQIIIRPPEVGGSSYTFQIIEFSGGSRFIVFKSMLMNQNGRYAVLRIAILPANEQALNRVYSIRRWGDLGSDASSHASYYSFTYNGRTYRYIMTWDWSSTPGYGDPNIWYFMVNIGRSNTDQYSYSLNYDDLTERLINVRGIALLYLAPTDNPLGDSYIAQFLRQELAFWEQFQGCVFEIEGTSLYAICQREHIEVPVSLALNGTIKIGSLLERNDVDRVLVWDESTGLVFWRNVSTLVDNDWVYNDTWIWPAKNVLLNNTIVVNASLLSIQGIERNDTIDRVLVLDRYGHIHWRSASTIVDNDWMWNETTLYTEASTVEVRNNLKVLGSLILPNVTENTSIDRALVIDDRGRVYWRTIESLVSDNDWEWNSRSVWTYKNVGIGTNNPSVPLHVVAPGHGTELTFTIINPNSYDLVDYQIRIDLRDYLDEPRYLMVTDENGNELRFCYEQSNGECSVTPSKILWVKIPRIPANGKITIRIEVVNTNHAVDGAQVFDFYGSELAKHTLYNAHHNPTTRDIYDYYWSDAGRDAFDGYGYTYLCSDPTSNCQEIRLNIRPLENNGRIYEVTLNNGAKFIVYKDMLPNQNNRPAVLRIVLLPANREAMENYFSVYRYGNLGSDSRTYSNYYSFTYNGRTYRYIMTWDWSSTPGYGDPNIWYFMASLYEGYNPNSYSYRRSGDNLYEYLDYAKGLTILYLAPSDNPLGDTYIANLLRQELDYFNQFRNCIWSMTESGILMARKYTDREPLVISLNTAGVFEGDVIIEGNLFVTGTKSFDIPHPDPDKASKGWRLRHAAVESNEVLVMYRGVVVINRSGFAIIKLPEYFKYLVNISTVTIHLTKYGKGDVWVYMEDYEHHRIVIQGTPGLKVSWIVLGVRSGYEDFQNEYLPQQLNSSVSKQPTNNNGIEP